jgi:hypothetical protein
MSGARGISGSASGPFVTLGGWLSPAPEPGLFRQKFGELPGHQALCGVQVRQGLGLWTGCGPPDHSERVGSAIVGRTDPAGGRFGRSSRGGGDFPRIQAAAKSTMAVSSGSSGQMLGAEAGPAHGTWSLRSSAPNSRTKMSSFRRYRFLLSKKCRDEGSFYSNDSQSAPGSSLGGQWSPLRVVWAPDSLHTDENRPHPPYQFRRIPLGGQRPGSGHREWPAVWVSSQDHSRAAATTHTEQRGAALCQNRQKRPLLTQTSDGRVRRMLAWSRRSS